MNIVMFLIRIKVLNMDGMPPNQGKKYEWDQDYLNILLDQIKPSIEKSLKHNQDQANKRQNKIGKEAFLQEKATQRVGSIHNNMPNYPVKLFIESYSIIKFVYTNPAQISYFADDPSTLVNAMKPKTE